MWSPWLLIFLRMMQTYGGQGCWVVAMLLRPFHLGWNLRSYSLDITWRRALSKVWSKTWRECDKETGLHSSTIENFSCRWLDPIRDSWWLAQGQDIRGGSAVGRLLFSLGIITFNDVPNFSTSVSSRPYWYRLILRRTALSKFLWAKTKRRSSLIWNLRVGLRVAKGYPSICDLNQLSGAHRLSANCYVASFVPFAVGDI